MLERNNLTLEPWPTGIMRKGLKVSLGMKMVESLEKRPTVN
jgi:hypothetical protein